MTTTFSLIVAMDSNGLIGSGGRLPWKLPADLRRFKEITMGKPIIMGRKTCASIGKPLPGRRNIVLTRSPDFKADGFEVFHSRDEVEAALAGDEEAMVIGGAEIYRLFMDRARRAYVTLIDGEFEGDVYFPEWPLGPRWHVTSEELYAADDRNPYWMTFAVFGRTG